MVPCWYCGHDFDEDDDRQGIGHAQCVEEFHRREREGICTYCGKNGADDGNRTCGTCFAAPKHPNFQGYAP